MAAVRVWDPLVRVSHWLLMLCVAVAWLTRHGGGAWHERAGYVALAIVSVRIAWGWMAPSNYARFSNFIHSPRITLRYAQQIATHTESRHLGHNPLGGWMIVALMLTLVLTGLTGWLYTTDRYWGVEWVEDLHRSLANLLWVFVPLHVAGVLFASWRHHENLIAAMIHGRKRS